MGTEVPSEVLQEQIKNIKESQERQEINTNKALEKIEKLFKEWKDDLASQYKSLGTRVETLYGYHEQSKDDRRDLHRIGDAHALTIKDVEKDIADIKTTVKILTDGKVETNGFKKGLENFAKITNTVAAVIISLGVIGAAIIVAINYFSSLHK